ncbi:MAG: hypothetical protein EA361_16335 [Bacteroidetes bacterium]|nr:MAG: hypothetical protein EA361_16335 [Bacteroidota bacterium]
MKSQQDLTYDLIVIGDGCAGFLLLHELSRYPAFARQKVLLLGEGKEQHRSWCFWDTGLEAPFQQMVRKSWKELSFKSDNIDIRQNLGTLNYYYIPGESFFRYFREDFIPQNPHVNYRSEKALEINGSDGDFKVITGSAVYKAKKVYNSAFLGQKPSIDIWQHFRGWFIETGEAVFDPGNAVLMDFSVSRSGESRFMYVLPLSEKEALVELTCFSPQPLEMAEYDIAIEDYISAQVGRKYKILEKEYGQIPMQQGVFQLEGTKGEINMGTLAGMAKASTGYAFQRIRHDSKLLAEAYFTGRKGKRTAEKGRFAFYDSLLLWIIRYHPKASKQIFTRLFQRRRMELILRFLDQKTNLWEEINIFARLPVSIFLKALYYRFSGKRIAEPEKEPKLLRELQNV